MSNKYDRYRVEIPALVRQAMSLAEELGFPLMPEGRPAGYQGPPSACIPEVGRLLSVLAAGCPNGKVAEFGTGAGVGTAWLLHGLPATSRLFSAEKDGNLVTRTRKLFEKYPNVEIRQGDCFVVLQDEMPFDLLFSDVGIRQVLKPENWDTFTEMVKVGGKIVFDDLLPIELWPLTLALTTVITFWGSWPSSFVSESASGLQDFMLISLVFAALILAWGYLCVGIGYGLYKLLQHARVIKEEGRLDSNPGLASV